MLGLLYHAALGLMFFFIFLIIFLPLWIYATTKNWSLALFFGDENNIAKNTELTPTQALLLGKMVFLRHLSVFLVIIYAFIFYI